MRRREFIALASAGAAYPLAARAQQQPIIGFLNSASSDSFAAELNTFRQGLKEAGYTEGQNVAIEYRWANDEYDRLATLADDLVRQQVSVIVANTPANLAAKKATKTIPIIFTTGGDPIKLGLVASLDRPGGNVTGVTQLTAEVTPKRLELLHELLPSATVFALLVNPTDPGFTDITEIETAARKLGLQLHVLRAGSERDFDGVFDSVTKLHAAGLVINAGAFFADHAEHLAARALSHALPTIFEYRRFVAAGGLASYGGNSLESYRLAGAYAGRVLKGENPANLPVQQSTKIELFINLKTAKALNIAVPQGLLVAADEVIE